MKLSGVASNQKFKRPYTLGIEGGGTRTVALMVDATGQTVLRREFGSGNLRLLDERGLASLLRSITRAFPRPDAVGLGLAGARTKADQTRVKEACGKIWKKVPVRVTHDLDVALMAAFNQREKSPYAASVLVLSGTGSCCYGRAADGRTAKMGGWGHILGDKGSGYEIGLRGLKAVVFYLDRDGTWSQLGERLLAATGCNEPDELIDWAALADKHTVAALAVEVFAARKKRDAIARDIIVGAVSSLAKDAVNCARKLAGNKETVEFILAGGVLLQQPSFVRETAAAIRKRWPEAKVGTLRREGVWGAVTLCKDLAREKGTGREKGVKAKEILPLAPTEKRNPRSKNLDQMPLIEAVELMLSEESRGVKAVRREAQKIVRVVSWVAKAFKEGGRLIYVGAGTSGRLGVLDASECPPTFRAEPGQVQGIIAGGPRALTNAIEGAEDDADAGGRAIQFRGVTKKDVVVGIAASGRTPFVWGALESANNCGAKSALICFNPSVKRRGGTPSLILAPAIGSEVLTGSTRLKAGTATKLILNCITTLAMVKLGKVAGNLMVDLNPKNEKLRERAIRIVTTLTNVNSEQSKKALEQANWVIKDALAKLGQ
ncbi:MAG: N-acetylmuramic acid 6-phosphate etherase [Verrucomicrobiota bacterium]|nr:N-acetylmuramic acid 6-phosphate etherase [Verrucomicrobiota bacterium]